MEHLDIGTSESVGRDSVKMRTKKKSTLAKLKEKKLREQGSLTSLQSFHEKQEEKSFFNDSSWAYENTHSKTSTGNLESDIIFSTKDPPETASEIARPKPRPRGRRQSSCDGLTGFSKSDELDGTANSGPTLQDRLKDLKMSGPYDDSADPTISNSGFIPKPPVTPRSQNSNPRTPRNYVPISKGEKRPREHRSSGEEAEVDEKKEKCAEIRKESLKSFSSKQQSHVENKLVPSHTTTERLLKRRNSKDSSVETKTGLSGSSSHASNGVGKPPVYNHPYPHGNLNNSSNRSCGNDLPYPSPSLMDSSLHQSPRGKYLKSANQSHKDRSCQQQEDSSKRKIMSTVETPQASNLRSSSPTQLLVTQSAEPSSLHKPNVSSTGSTDKDNFEDSNQVPESPWKVSPLVPPSSPGRLEPISPRPNPPPPLEDNFSSQSLRTTFRIDPNVRPSTGNSGRGRTATTSSVSGGRGGTGGTGNVDKSDSGATSYGDRVSQQSFASGSVLPVITTKEARSR